MSNLVQKRRIFWIDAAKAIGIFCIVFGHVLQTGILNKAVYTFHVPLFFFLSGVVFHYEEYDFLQLAKKQAKVLLYPYYIWAAFSIVVYFSMGHFIGESLAGHMGYSLPETIYLSLIGYSPTNRPLWFLPCLYVMQLLLLCCIRLEAMLQKKQFFRCVVIVICIFFAGLYSYFPHYKIPFAIDKAVALFPFIYSGYIVRKREGANEAGKKQCFSAITFLLFGLIIGIALNSQLDYRNLILGNPIFFYISAVACVIGICGICKCLRANKVLSYVGKNTMPILVLHKFPILFFQAICPYVKIMLGKNDLVWSVLVSGCTIVMCGIATEVLRYIYPASIGGNARKE